MIATQTAAALFVMLLTAAPVVHAQAPPTVSVHIDPTSTLDSRIGDTDPSVLRMFADAGMPTPSAHALTDAERQSLARAFATFEKPMQPSAGIIHVVVP